VKLQAGLAAKVIFINLAITFAQKKLHPKNKNIK
jgi:hypothetical protein